jgi:hypothetical protein
VKRHVCQTQGPLRAYANQKLSFNNTVTTCHPEVSVKRARVFTGAPSTRGFCFARGGVVLSALVGPRDLLRPNFLRPQAEQ